MQDYRYISKGNIPNFQQKPNSNINLLIPIPIVISKI